MKKSPLFAVSVFFVLLTLAAASVSAQSFTWNNPQKITSAHVKAILPDTVGTDPVTVYGIEDDDVMRPLVLATAETGTPAAAGAVPPPVTAFAMDLHGILYAISPKAVTAYDGTNFIPLDSQPSLPLNLTGDYKDIAVGKGGKVYVLYEVSSPVEAAGDQYLLVGEPPALTEDVTVAITPVVLNLASKGNWLNAFITPPEGYDVEDILVDSIQIVRIQGTGPNGPIDEEVSIPRASAAPYKVQREKLHFKFPRQTLAGLLTTLFPSTGAKATYNLTLTIEGQLDSGEYFAGTTSLIVQVPKAKGAKK